MNYKIKNSDLHFITIVLNFIHYMPWAIAIIINRIQLQLYF